VAYDDLVLLEGCGSRLPGLVWDPSPGFSWRT